MELTKDVILRGTAWAKAADNRKNLALCGIIFFFLMLNICEL